MNNRQDAKIAKRIGEMFTRNHEAHEGIPSWRFWRLGGSIHLGAMEMI
jgi:hypothetical protein